MRTLFQQLSNYAAYHRDRRNIATHFAGIPMIVVASTTLLARPSPLIALAVAGLSAAFYLKLDLRYGLAMAGVLALSVWAGVALAALPMVEWLVAGVGLFLVGWIFQLVGHVFEGRKPAFVDDLIGLLVGPLFVVAEAGFALGLRDDLRLRIEAEVGPTRSGPARLSPASEP